MRERAAFALALLSEQNPSAVADHLASIILLLDDNNYKIRLSAFGHDRHPRLPCSFVD